MWINELNKFWSSSGSASLPTREEIEDGYKWDLSHIYKDESNWEDDFNWIENNLNEYKKYEGKLSDSPQTLLECLRLDDNIGIKLGKLHLYAMLSKDSDMRVTKYQGMSDRIQSLFAKVTETSSFIRPELLSVPEDQFSKMVSVEKELQLYGHLFDDLIRTKAHTLTKEMESLLAQSSEVAQIPYNTFAIFTNADIKFPVIKDEKGVDIELSHARYYAAVYSKDREFRIRAFKSYYQLYKDYANTFSSLFSGNLKSHIFTAVARNYKSTKEAALDRNNIPVSVYDNLISAVNENLNPLHRWASIRKRILKINELHPYDAYVSLFEASGGKKYPFEEAKKIVIKALKPLGEEYLSTLNKAFADRWLDVYETKGKRSGAYSSGATFGIHPYVLLNWTEMLNDLFTLAHEMGHNMHSYYTGKSQPYPYANYSIFVAEVASTFNESLLLDYLIINARTKNEKLFLIEKYVNNISSTFYRQTMFAEFESKVYDISEKGMPLTPDVLCGMYKDLFQKYWGPDMVVDEEEEYTWARVPHFYYNYYVYQYATGFAASEVLAGKVKTEGNKAVEKYLNFLKSGSSDYPINILKDAGVNMNSSEPILATTLKMNDLLNEMEKLI